MTSRSAIPDNIERAVLENSMDITELKEAKIKIEEFKNLESSILDAAPDAIFGMEDRRIIFANRAAEAVFGWKPEELIGKSTRLLYPTKEEYERMGQMGYGALEKERIFIRLECPCIRKDGKEIICRITSARIGGTLTGRKIVATYEDITEIKRTEEMLKESEERYRSLAEGSVAGVCVVQDGRFRYMNTITKSYTGYLYNELIGRRSNCIVHPEDRKSLRRNCIDMIRGKRSSPYEYRIIKKNGDIRWIMETVSPIMYGGKRAVLGNSMDITESKEAKIKIEEFKNLESSILDAAPNAIFGMEDRRIIFANRATETVFGWKPEELIGKSTMVLYPTKKEYERMGQMGYGALEKERIFVRLECPCIRKDRKEIICRITAARIGKSLTSKKIVVTYEDITEWKKADDNLRKKTKELEVKTIHLGEMNIALKVLLNRIEEDKKELEENVINNVRELILPSVDQMKKHRLDTQTREYLSVIESNLTKIISPFIRILSLKKLNLTPSELFVANLLKEGKTSKEISNILGITVRGVEFHRNKIRTKLGIINKKENLRAYLLSTDLNENT